MKRVALLALLGGVAALRPSSPAPSGPAHHFPPTDYSFSVDLRQLEELVDGALLRAGLAGGGQDSSYSRL